MRVQTSLDRDYIDYASVERGAVPSSGSISTIAMTEEDVDQLPPKRGVGFTANLEEDDPPRKGLVRFERNRMEEA